MQLRFVPRLVPGTRRLPAVAVRLRSREGLSGFDARCPRAAHQPRELERQLAPLEANRPDHAWRRRPLYEGFLAVSIALRLDYRRRTLGEGERQGDLNRHHAAGMRLPPGGRDSPTCGPGSVCR